MRPPARTGSLLGLFGLAACGSESPSTPQCLPECELVVSGEPTLAASTYELGLELATGAITHRVVLERTTETALCATLRSRVPLADLRWNGARADLAVEDGRLIGCGLDSGGGRAVISSRPVVPLGSESFGGVGLTRRRDRFGNEFTYLLGWIEECDRFGPCDTSPLRRPEVVFDVSHAATDVVLCPGEREPSKTRTRCRVTAPTYSSFAALASPALVRRPFVEAAGVSLVFYEVPGGRLADSLDPAIASGFLEWLVARLGPHPYGAELRIVGAPTPWLGMEHPGNIVLRDDLPTLPGDFADMTRHTLFHEIVHQWAGNRTTLVDRYDWIWKEAIAEYLVYVYEELVAPADAERTLAAWDRYARLASYFPRPLDEPAPPLVSFGADIYGTGPMLLLLQLEDLVGRPAVMKGISAFLADPSARGTMELVAAIATAAEVDLAPYVSAWLVGAGDPEWPTFRATTEVDSGELHVTVTQLDPRARRWPCVVEVHVEGDAMNVDVLVSFGLAPTSDTATASVPFRGNVTAVVIDPGHRLVDRGSAVGLETARRPTVPFHP